MAVTIPTEVDITIDKSGNSVRFRSTENHPTNPSAGKPVVATPGAVHGSVNGGSGAPNAPQIVIDNPA
jgi:hypothetical protein